MTSFNLNHLVFANGLDQAEQQAAHDRLMAAKGKRNQHVIRQIVLNFKPHQLAESLIEIDRLVNTGVPEDLAIAALKGDLRKALEWNTNIQYSTEKGEKRQKNRPDLRDWTTYLAASKTAIANAAETAADGSVKFKSDYANMKKRQKGHRASHEHIITNMTLIHQRAYLAAGGDIVEATRRVRALMEMCATLMIGDEENLNFKTVKAGNATLADRMPEGFNIETDSPFARYIAAGFDLTELVINPMWL